MLTPQEVSGKTFPKSSSFSGGYNMAAVDEFLDTLTEDYTSLYKENAALKAKLKVLAEKMEEYRATEDAMRSTLLAAQKMAAAMTEEAEEKSRKLVADAEAESRKMLDDARAAASVANSDFEQKTVEARKKLELAQSAMEDFIAKSLAMCMEQVRVLEQFPHSELPCQAQEEKQATEAPAEEFAEEKQQETPVTQDTIRIVEKEILAAYEAQQEQPAQEEVPAEETIEPDTDFASEFKLNLDELQFGRNYDPDKQ